ncbi:MAG: aldehyde dehydrogenase family protein, partial [Brevibacterium sp.]|nr:aldehyde dehydrogenase family protein [Brevibacterium sp.]
MNTDVTSTVTPSADLWQVTDRLREFLDTVPYAEASGSGERMTSPDPFTGETHARFTANTADDVDRAYASARIAGRAWASRSPEHRARVLLRLHSALRRHEDLLLDIVQYETGKARIHAYDE